MLSRIIVPSILLAAFSNGLAIRRDDGIYSISSSPPGLSLPTISPEPILLPDPSISLSLPPLNPSSTGTPASSLPPPSSSPSVVTTTVYVYPTQCPPTPTANPSGILDDDNDDGDDGDCDDDSNCNGIDSDNNGDPSTQPTPVTLPQETPLNLPPVRRDDNADSVVSKMRDLEQQVMNTFVDQGKGDVMLSVLVQIDNLIAQAVAPGADLNSLLQQAQDLVNSS